jgi:hypothetical protein
MRIKKSTHHSNYTSSEQLPALDLDPTSNSELYLSIWKTLKDKIEAHTIKKTTPSNLRFYKGSPEDGFQDNVSKERRFGQDMRRLVNLVCRAFLNPGMSNI